MPHKTSPWCAPFVSLLKGSLICRLYLSAQLVELKNGETFNGHLVNCDNFMNITLREVYQTSADGDRFWKVKECYIRGSTVCLTLSPSFHEGTQYNWLLVFGSR
jgi:small nuclear ribonucleoprotein (snRNP)-like protein